MKRILCFFFAAALLCGQAHAVTVLRDDDIVVAAPSAVLIEKESGELIYDKNSHERLPPASVTKVMTMLLIVEAIDSGSMSLDDTVIASERAARFGGSCVYLEEGEKMSVGEMLKCISVVSANDCAVAMAEFMCGTEQAFVKKMNERAQDLNLADTHFTNCTGLFDDDEHYTSAYDIAIMSRELLMHPLIKDYTTIWMDSIRGGEFGLSNTNKLVYYYEGCTGLKTGYTSLAGYCLSASAERDGMELIAVIMNGESSASRNEDAKTLLSFGFASYAVYPLRASEVLPPVSVTLGECDSVQPVYDGESSALILKQEQSKLRYEVELPDSIAAPIESGQQIGTLKVYLGDEVFRSVPLAAGSSVSRASLPNIFLRLLSVFAGLQ